MSNIVVEPIKFVPLLTVPYQEYLDLLRGRPGERPIEKVPGLPWAHMYLRVSSILYIRSRASYNASVEVKRERMKYSYHFSDFYSIPNGDIESLIWTLPSQCFLCSSTPEEIFVAIEQAKYL